MFVHATLPGLPPHLWQAAFLLDLTRHHPAYRGSKDLNHVASRLAPLCTEVVARRKAAEGR